MALRLLSVQRLSSLTATATATATRFTGHTILRRPQLIDSFAVGGLRFASVKAQGAYKKKCKRGIPKKLGAKRTGDQFVIPGNIIYKQRGSVWWPGENCIMGRDHTIHAMATGYVKYYRDPARHPDRKYIGVVFNKDDKLPYPVHAERKRRLNMTAHPLREAKRAMCKFEGDDEAKQDDTEQPLKGKDENGAAEEKMPEMSPSGIPWEVRRVQAGEPDRLLRLRDDYSYREDNWRIGRLVKTTGLKLKRFRTRKQWLRNRRWRRDREIEGQREAAKRRAEEEARDGEAAAYGRGVKAVSKKKAKQAKRDKRETQRNKGRGGGRRAK